MFLKIYLSNYYTYHGARTHDPGIKSHNALPTKIAGHPSKEVYHCPILEVLGDVSREQLKHPGLDSVFIIPTCFRNPCTSTSLAPGCWYPWSSLSKVKQNLCRMTLPQHRPLGILPLPQMMSSCQEFTKHTNYKQDSTATTNRISNILKPQVIEESTIYKCFK